MKQHRFVLEVFSRGTISVKDHDIHRSFWLPNGNGFVWRDLLKKLDDGDRIVVVFPKKKEQKET